MLTSKRVPSFRRRTVSRAVKLRAAQHLGAKGVVFRLAIVGDAGQAPAHHLSRRPPEDGLRGPVPAQHLAPGRERDDRQRGSIDERLELLTRRAHQLLGRPAFGHVALGTPDGGQEAILDHAEQVVDEPALRAVPIELARLELDGPVSAADEGAEELEAPRVSQIERRGELRSEELLPLRATVHPHHRLVDLDQAGVARAARDLVRFVGPDRDGRLDGRAPDALGRAFDEEPVLLPAVPELVGRPGDLGDVLHHDQPGLPAREGDRVTRDPDQQDAAVLPQVPPRRRPHAAGRPRDSTPGGRPARDPLPAGCRGCSSAGIHRGYTRSARPRRR